MAKLTEEEIRTAGQAAHDAYYEDGYWAVSYTHLTLPTN